MKQTNCYSAIVVVKYLFLWNIYFSIYCEGFLIATPKPQSPFVKTRFVIPHSFAAQPPFSASSSSSSPLPTLRKTVLLTTTADDNNNNPGGDEKESKSKIGPIHRAVQKFRARPGTYLLIPCVAAVVGWVTNWMAVQMIFYPVQFRGIPLYIRPEVPLGLIGWQGIVPCKTRPMSEAMVDMVTSQLLTVKEVFGRLEPRQVAKLLAPEVPKLAKEIVSEVAAPIPWITALPGAIFAGMDAASQAILRHFNIKFLESLTRSMQQNIDNIFDLKSCVVNQMLQDRTMLGELFWKCGQKELDFLTNSGLWFGFLLGIIQMIVALFWDNPWSLSIGGGIVGYATNWLALKWIFEPVDPTRFGPFVLQGQFLRRQKEVSAEFSKFFANNILTSEKLWNSVLTDPNTSPAFVTLFSDHFMAFVNRITRGLRIMLEPETMAAITDKAIKKLPNHVPVLYDYMDKTLALEGTLRVRMEHMTSRQFERVLHPIFEEDELTLIIAGAVLGFAAGLIQQGLETGQIKVPDIWTPFRKNLVALIKSPKQQTKSYLKQLASTATSTRIRLVNLVRDPLRSLRRNQSAKRSNPSSQTNSTHDGNTS